MSNDKHPLAAFLSRAGKMSIRRDARSFSPPRKALILQPCCLGRVMLTTPLLAALGDAFPDSRFDWAISDWALQAISSNPRVTRTIRSGTGDLDANSKEEMREFIETVRAEAYDTCFIPSRSTVLAQAAWQAGIPQRVGLDNGRRLRSHTIAVQPPAAERWTARTYLSLAVAVGVDEALINRAQMEFHPTDSDRTTVTRWLVEELDWLGDVPLVVMHPGGGENPSQVNPNKRWPAYRFARLANRMTSDYKARVVLVGTAEDKWLADQVAGMVPFPVMNRAGRVGLGELGALCELASLYIGNDVGSTHVAAATGCPTLAIYGPTDPSIYAPYMVNGRVKTLWRAFEGEFDWSTGVSVEEAVEAVEPLLSAYTLNGAAID